MNKNDPSPLSFSLMDHPFVQQLLGNKRILLWGGMAVFVLLLAVYKMSASGSYTAQENFIKAARDFSTLANNKTPATPLEKEEALEELKTILSRHPDLAPKYEGWLAQVLINQGNINQALPLAKATLKRTEANDLPLFHSFAATSLLVASHSYEEALTEALSLKEQLSHSAENSSYSSLLAFNQLRIATLQQLLGHEEEARAAWKELKTLAASDAIRPLFSSFTIGNTTLLDSLPN